MSTVPPTAVGSSAGIPAPALMHGPERIRIYGHSTIFYWWPVWALGFLMTLISLFDNTRIIHVPGGTAVEKRTDTAYELVNSAHPDEMKQDLQYYLASADPDDQRPPPRASHRAWMGATFCIVLLLVISITNVPLRGLWSVVVIVTIVLGVVILALIPGAWDRVLHAIGGLHIYIGMAGYLFIGTVLFIMWCAAMFVFDRQIYMEFEPGQMKVVEEVGGGEKSYDTAGMSIEKHRDDLFRHWVLGLGSGDLEISTTGAKRREFTARNVLFIGTKLARIERLVAMKPDEVPDLMGVPPPPAH
jgi:hypothetical protein